MDGQTHRKIAPVFTAGATYLTLVSRDYAPTAILATVALASGISILSANWADADLPARCKPVPAIWAGTKIGKCLGIKKATVVDKKNTNKTKTVYIYKNKRYTKTHGLDMRILATVFRLLGVRGHRVWQSHSPILWVPLVLFMYASYLALFGDDNIVSAVLVSIPLGLGYGYLSHLFGDMLTYQGLPLLPDFKFLSKVPVLGGVLGKINKRLSNVQVAKVGFAKASNKTWNNIVFLGIIIIVGYILAPQQMNILFGVIWSVIKGIVLSIGQAFQYLTSNYIG